MDRREILSKGANLQKAINGKEPAANIMNLLQDLKSHVRPTEELLRATSIGKIVNRVKSNNALDPKVTQLASEIISRWRHTVNEQKVASGTSTPTGRGTNGTLSPAPTSKPASSPPATSTMDRNWKKDKIHRETITNDPVRNNCIGLVYDGLCIGSDLPALKILDLAKAVESAALNLPEAKGDSNSAPYKDKIRSLFQNLKNKSNPQLRQRILSGEISADHLVIMSHEELKSKEQQAEQQRLEKENLDKAMVPQAEKSVSSSLECGKCHQKKVSYSQAQTRSADEPMTTFCECLVCGNRWKFS